MQIRNFSTHITLGISDPSRAACKVHRPLVVGWVPAPIQRKRLGNYVKVNYASTLAFVRSPIQYTVFLYPSTLGLLDSGTGMVNLCPHYSNKLDFGAYLDPDMGL